MSPHRSRFLVVSVLATAVLAGGACSDTEAGGDSAASGASAAAVVLTDRPLPVAQGELLELAFEAASAMPLQPHVKNRSREQEHVVVACLELDQPGRALRYVERIENWRRGAGYADLAHWCVLNGESGQAQVLLDLATDLADATAAEDPAASDEDEGVEQTWRQDRIRAKVARTLLFLGRGDEAADLSDDLADSEAALVAATRASLADEQSFDAELQAVDAVVQTGSFEQVRGALAACARLFDQVYEDRDRRGRARDKIQSSWQRLPVVVRIELLMELAGSALGHDDPQGALELVGQAEDLLDSTTWTAEDRVPLMARLAGLHAEAGDDEGARRRADAAMEVFDQERATIINMFRTDALVPVAEAYLALGSRTSALAVYMRALEESLENPNSRPRAEDLVSICTSMARLGLEPDAGLWTRLRQVRADLGEPW